MFGLSPWKLGTIGAAILALIIGGFLFASSVENKRISKERDKMALAINDPNTGYIARLTQARTNVVQLEEAIRVQNATFQRESQAAQANLARLKVELAAAQRRSAEAERRLAAFMATKPQGATLEDRVNDIDQRILKDLNRAK